MGLICSVKYLNSSNTDHVMYILSPKNNFSAATFPPGSRISLWIYHQLLEFSTLWQIFATVREYAYLNKSKGSGFKACQLTRDALHTPPPSVWVNQIRYICLSLPASDTHIQSLSFLNLPPPSFNAVNLYAFPPKICLLEANQCSKPEALKISP